MTHIYFIKNYITTAKGHQSETFLMDFADSEEVVERRLKYYKQIEELDNENVTYHEARITSYGNYIGAYLCVKYGDGSHEWWTVERENVLQKEDE